jgi:hypothetical protein
MWQTLDGFLKSTVRLEKLKESHYWFVKFDAFSKFSLRLERLLSIVPYHLRK